MIAPPSSSALSRPKRRKSSSFSDFAESQPDASSKLPGYSMVTCPGSNTKALVGPSGQHYHGYSLGVLGVHSPTRRAFIRLNEWKALERFFLFAIILNCVFISLQGPPNNPDSFVGEPYDSYIELAFTILFTIEMSFHILAMGFLFGPHSYLRDTWNQLDFVVILMGWLPYLIPSLNNVSAIRCVRALRPLRTINRLPGIKKQVATLLDSLPKLSDVAALSAFILVLFGVLGVQLFQGGLLHRCYEEGATEPISPADGVCSNNGVANSRGTCEENQLCLYYGQNPNYGTNGFDNIAIAWMTIFQCVTLEGWTDVMYMTQRAFGSWSAMYFIFLTLMGSFYVVNLFLAVMYDTYITSAIDTVSSEHDGNTSSQSSHTAKDKELYASLKENTLSRAGLKENTISRGTATSVDGSSLDESSIASRSLPRRLTTGSANLDPPSNGVETHSKAHCWKAWCLLVTESSQFQNVIVLTIIVNTALMMVERYPMPEWQSQLLEHANVYLTLVFVAEMILKLSAHGLHAYWADPFNRFDGVVVATSVVDIIVNALLTDVGVNTSVLRAFRLMRIFKLARSWSGLQVMLNALTSALSQLANLFALLALLIFICALLGMQVLGGSFSPETGFETVPRTNFDSLVNSMLTVFVVVSGENWNDVWMDAKAAVGVWLAPYFILLVVMGNYVVLNLFVAILFDGFSKQANRHQSASVSRESSLLERDSFIGCVIAVFPSWRPFIKRRREYALFIFPPGHSLRKFASAVTTCRYLDTPLSFDNFIIALIIATSAALAFESCELDPESDFALVLSIMNVVATCIFVVEMLVKILAQGLVFPKNAYLRSGWNVLDGVIVLFSVLALVGNGSPAIRVLRMLRVLRPLRLISRFDGMRLVVQLLISTIPNVVQVLMVNLLFMTVFAILGVQLFSGKFAQCVTQPELLTRDACLQAGHAWQNPRMGSFDNFGSAMLLLFECATIEGWPDVLFATVDAARQGEAPKINHSPEQGLFLISWIVIGGMFLINVFVGVVFDSFAKMKEDEELGVVDARQKQFILTLEATLKVKPVRYPPCPDNPLRAWCYRMVKKKWFEQLVLSIILLNAAILAADYYEAGPEYLRLLSLGNDFCLVAFVVEAILKILALSFSEYIIKPWNVFDFSIIVISLLHELIVTFGDSTLNPSLARLLRIVRVVRLLRAIKSARRIRSMLTTLIFSLPALANISSIFCIVLFLFSVLGMQLFGDVMHGEFLNDDANFCHFTSSAMTMFRSATGEAWNGIMHDVMVSPDQGCSIEAGNCGSWTAIPFFVSYMVVANFVVLNMMIAIIIEEFQLTQKREEYRLRPEQTEAFVNAWAEFDPYATGRMSVRHLREFIGVLPPPLGLDPRDFPLGRIRSLDVTALISSLEGVQAYENLEGRGPEVVFRQILDALTNLVYADVSKEIALQDDTQESRFMRQLRLRRETELALYQNSRSPKNNLVELHSACVIQQRWKETAPKRMAKKMQYRREAVRLRQAGTLVPMAFLGRAHHSVVLYKGRLFVFGGRNADGALKDFWEYSLNAGFWVDHSFTVPLRMRPRWGHMAHLSHSRMLVVGGFDGERYMSDVWECDLNALYWRQVGFSAEETERADGVQTVRRQRSSDFMQLQSGFSQNLLLGTEEEIEEAEQLASENLELEHVFERNAIRIQSAFRGKASRSAFRKVREEWLIESAAATVVAAVFRGHLVRRQTLRRTQSETARTASTMDRNTLSQFNC